MFTPLNLFHAKQSTMLLYETEKESIILSQTLSLHLTHAHELRKKKNLRQFVYLPVLPLNPGFFFYIHQKNKKAREKQNDTDIS